MIEVESGAFMPGDRIPKKHTGEGEDISPPLAWKGAPKGTIEFAVVCEDPDAPTAEPWVHWVVYGIAKERNALPEGTSGGGFDGKNSWGQPGYGGPMPPPGHGPHHYHFKVYALDEPTSLSLGASKKDLLRDMKDHVLDWGELVGTYER